jgi:hypothetical protein
MNVSHARSKILVRGTQVKMGKAIENPSAEPIFVLGVINEMILQPVQIFFHICFRPTNVLARENEWDICLVNSPEKINFIYD